MSGIWYESDVLSADDTGDESDAVVRPPKHIIAVSDQNFERGGGKSEWLGGSWPLKSFDGSLPTNKRKAEWIRYRDQFERIISCKAPVDADTKLTGLKIFAGDYLLSIIEMQHNAVPDRTEDVYQETIVALNRYFNQTCDATKERMKFRDMKMTNTESFLDWVLRLERQAKFCDFGREQREEEFVQALLRRSVPGIGEKLFEMSDFLGNNLERIINHGKHLDYIRTEADEAKKWVEERQDSSGQEQDASSAAAIKPVSALQVRKLGFRNTRVDRYRGPSRGRFEPYNSNSRNRVWSSKERSTHNCENCGRSHGHGECKAYRMKCYDCGKVGHFAEYCRSPRNNFSYANSRKRTNPEMDEKLKKEAGLINQLITRDTKLSQGSADQRFVYCTIGTESFKFLVDSGATVNTITSYEWETIKRNCRTVIQDVVIHPEEVLKSYANRSPLDVECSFRAYVGVTGHGQPTQLAKFFVVKGTNLSLLGYETAFRLNLIRIGFDQVNDRFINWTEPDETVTPQHELPGRSVDQTKANKDFPKMPIDGVRFKIDDSRTPKQIIRYNIPKAFESATNERLRIMEGKGIIERADKEQDIITYVSPLVLVPKGTNDFRIVVDYREVNKSIIREPYPMPSLEKIWSGIPNGRGTLFFTKLDLKDAYFHVELHEDVRHLTTFMTSNGLMRFKRLPFGLSCAPELFQRVMEKLLVNCKHIVIYLDDVLIYGRTLEELEGYVAEVKRVLSANNLTINEQKSVYNRSSVDFLGFTIDGSGILPLKDKISDIRLFKNPKDVSEVRSFLGMLTFISPFIKNFSHKTKPLRDLLASKSKFVWEQQHQKAFDDLKSAAENDLIKRGYFDENDKTILYTDASPWGLGAVLVQEDEEATGHRIIACASKSLTEAECRYPQLHREALAIVWAMERFAYYLLGRRFILRSDNEALMFMTKNKDRKDVGKRIMSRAEGWFLRMDHYCYDFEHVSGSDNIADAASRIGVLRNDPQFGVGKESHELCSVTANPVTISNELLVLTNAQVREESLRDVELQTVISWLNKNEKWPSEISNYQAFQRSLYMQGDILMKEEKMVLPSALRARALRLAHRSHPGMSTMKNFLRQGLWWPGMDREVEEYVRSCPECQLVTLHSTPLPITMTELPNNPWDYVSMDFATASEVNNWKALVLTDNYSRFLVAIPMGKTDADAVKKALKRVFDTYYVPKTLKADNGPPFNSIELEVWLKEAWGIKLIHSTPLNPTENGLVERSMQGINKITAIAKLGQQNWKEALADYVAAYNSWPHHVTKIPPAELMFGRAVRSFLPDARTDSKFKTDEELRERDQMAKFNRNMRADTSRHAQELQIKVGDMVLVSQQKRDKADSTYKNILHKVVQITGAGRATIMDLSTNRVYDRNVKLLKKFVERTVEKAKENADASLTQEENRNNTPTQLSPRPQQHQLTPREASEEEPTDERRNSLEKPVRESELPRRQNSRQIRRPQRYLNTVELPDYRYKK